MLFLLQLFKPVKLILMKRKMLYRILAVLVTASIFIGACTKENSNVRLAPTLATTQVSDINSASATVVGFVIAEGDGFTEKGVCYNTATVPTIANNKVIYTGTATTATFTVKISGLTYATKYYARAYATNATETIYGEEYTFTTLPVIPTVTTTAITLITGTTATGGGNVTVTGGADITARGICYGTTLNPTVADSKISTGTGAGAFVSQLVKLEGLTKYHVRAYATNSAGIAYGADVEFTTLVSTRTWNLPGDYVAASYPGSTLADWAPDKSPQVISLESAPDNVEGYVYMANPSNNWKFATQTNWNGPNYANNDAAGVVTLGILHDDAKDNINLPKGYYKINVNAAVSPMTYTALATTWGVIGDATIGGWSNQTNMVYDPTTRTFSLVTHLTAGGNIKFRGTSDWSVSYGSVSADGKLDTKDNNNIPVTVEADYVITLDLSHPNAYTYSANRWGVIGSATAGGWDSDQNLTWDAVNHVFTVTLNLTAGELKFRANDAWDLALGGTVDALTTSGGNIAIAAAGNYTITLDLSKATYTCVIKKN